jgi:hypothetical protein
MKCLLLTILLLLFTGCDKPESDCYVCTVTTMWVYTGHTVTSVKEFPYCNVDAEWIKTFETINTYSDTTTNMVQTCKCK